MICLINLSFSLLVRRKMNIQSLLQIDGTDIRVASLAQAGLIIIIALVIVLSNTIVLSSYINYRGWF